jgi:hypothetical protein
MRLAFLQTPRGIFATVVLVIFALMPWIGPLVGQPYLLEIFIRIMIWSIAAISLNLILGFGGMISFGHAAYIGIGGYTMGILSYYEIYSGWLHWPLALATSGLAALVFGAICLRTRGVYFIMITLAFAQMFYFLSVSAEEYGSDDGLPLDQRSEFAIGGWQFDISDNQTFYFIAFGFMLLALFVTYKIVNSRFGRPSAFPPIATSWRVSSSRAWAAAWPGCWRPTSRCTSHPTCCFGRARASSSSWSCWAAWVAFSAPSPAPPSICCWPNSSPRCRA